MIEVYRIFHNHITEVLERFPTFNAKEAERAVVMHRNFVKLTWALYERGKKLIKSFDFPLELPEFYRPDQE